MTFVEALTALGTLGPFVFAAGVFAGYRRHHLGRTHHDR
jgi:hypothetical protein